MEVLSWGQDTGTQRTLEGWRKNIRHPQKASEPKVTGQSDARGEKVCR